MKSIKRISRTILAAAAVILQCCVSSCDKNAHSGEEGIYIIPEFSNPDHKTAIKDVRILIYDNDGKQVLDSNFGSGDALASHCFELEAGNYQFVALVNLGNNGFKADFESASIKASVDDGVEARSSEDILITLDYRGAMSNVDLAPKGRGFYGVRDCSIKGRGYEVVAMPLKSFVSEVEFTMTGVTEQMTYTLNSYTSAYGFYLARKNLAGEYGRPTEDSAGGDLGLVAKLTAKNPVALFYIFPDSEITYGEEVPAESRMRLGQLPTASQDYGYSAYVSGPAMIAGHRYQMTLNVLEDNVWGYEAESVVAVNDWTEKWNLKGIKMYD